MAPARPYTPAQYAILLYILGIGLGVFLLVKSADWFTDAAVSIAYRLNVPDIIIGATLVSLATTLPNLPCPSPRR